MKMTHFAAAAALLLSTTAFGQVSETVSATPEANVPASTPSAVFAPSGSVLFNSGPLVNSPGTGSGGLDESLVQNTTLGMTTLGIRNAQATDRLADDFTVPATGWIINQIDFYGYQTGSPTTSSFTAMSLQIWDGPPQAAGSTVIFGDPTTNVMTATAFSNIYRASETASGANNRPIMANTVGGLNITLAPGTYWLDWSSTGSLASGPWAPPITINGQAITGNALVSGDVGVTYAAWNDGGSGDQQGAPFIISGTLPAVDADLSLAKSISAPTPVTVGSTMTFVLTASNAGPANAAAVVVTDILPSRVTYVSNTCGASFAGSTVTWNIGTLANGNVANCSIVTTVNGFGTISNTANISSSTNDPVPGNNSSTATSFGAQQPYMPIPSLGLWGLLLLGLTMTVVGVLVFRNR